MKKNINVVLILFVSLFCLVGCGNKNKIIGTWSGITTFTFNKDGTGSMGLGDMFSKEINYTIKDNKLSISYGSDMYTQTDEYIFKIEDDKLYLSDESGTGSWLIYEKSSSISKNNNETENVEADELTSDYLKDLIETTCLADDLLIGGPGYVDWDVFFENNGSIYYKLNVDNMNTIDDVKKYISKCYSSSIVNDFIDNGIIVEHDGALYSNTGGIGGLGSHAKSITAIKNGDYYTVTIHFDDPYDYGIGEHETTKQLINENGRWVFSERCGSNMTDYSDCEYNVE